MKKRALGAVLALFMLLAGTRSARAEALPDYVRLHVVAASDSTADQAMKLHVRDACLRRARESLADCPDADAAYAKLRADREGFVRAARAAAAEMGCVKPVRVEIGVFDFPDRIYGSLFLPAGEYRALRVVIGAGEGHNWWCVLYPSLCVLDEAIYASGQTPEIEFYSVVWDWLQKLFCC